MTNREKRYYVGTLFLMLPVAFMYLDTSLWFVGVSFFIGIIVFNWKKAENKLHHTIPFKLSHLAASFMGMSWVQATRETVDFGLLIENTIDYIPFQLAYTIFVLSHCYVKAVVEPKIETGTGEAETI